MNEMNFNSLKNIKAPQEWLDKAAAIPETIEEKPAAVPVRRIAAAASIVLVSAVGLMVFLFFGNGNTGAPFAVRQDRTSVTEVTSGETCFGETRESAAPAETIAVYSTDSQGNTIIAYRDKTAATESGVHPTEKRRSNISPTAPNASAAPSSPRSTEKPSSSLRATEGVSAPTEAPAAATELPEPTKPPLPTNPPATQLPTEGNSSVESVLSFFATFDSSLLNEGEAVYCIYSPVGYATGSGTSTKKQQADYFITKYGIVFASCDVLIDEPLPAEAITYQYCFVNERGHRLASGTQTM